MGLRTAIVLLAAAALILICVVLAAGNSNRGNAADDLLQSLARGDSLAEEYSKMHEQFEKDHQARVQSKLRSNPNVVASLTL